MITRCTSALVVALALSTVGSSAAAFDYPEHAAISANALRAVLAGPSSQAQALDRALAALLAGLPPKVTTCGAQSRESVTDNCLSLADIPALSGDHAASPLLLFWRWFDACTSSGDKPPWAYSTLDMFGRLSHSDREPETVPTGIPQTVSRFICYVHSQRLTRWPIPAGSTWTSDDDGALQDIDGAYASLAIDGHSHFRPGVARFDVAYAAQRSVYTLPGDRTLGNKPQLNAFAWYADLHAGAVLYARLAELRAEAPARDLFRAASIYLELAADHYLEDGVSAGHMVSLARELDPGTLNVVHDRACRDGVHVYPPTALCRDAHPYPLNAVCAERTTAFTVLGDHAVSAGWGNTNGMAELTFQWASAVVQESLREVMRASSDPHLDPEALRLGEAFDGILPSAEDPLTWFTPHESAVCPASRVASETQFYRALIRWWETQDCAPRRSQVIALVDAAGYFDAADALPAPALADGEVDGRASRFSGPGWFVETGATGILDRDLRVATPEFMLGWHFVAPKNRYAAIQAAIGGGFGFESTSNGGGQAFGIFALAARQSLYEHPWLFFEEQVPVRRMDDWQTGLLLGVGAAPFERTSGVLTVGFDAGMLFDKQLNRAVPAGLLNATFGVPMGFR